MAEICGLGVFLPSLGLFWVLVASIMAGQYIGSTTENDPIYHINDLASYAESDLDTESSTGTDNTMSTLESREANSRF